MRYAPVGDHGDWRTAIEEYYWDRLDTAYGFAQEIGVGFGGGYEGWYRTIEAEAITREQGDQEALNDWLTVEVVPHELGHGGLARHEVHEVVGETCEEVACRFGFATGAKTLVTVLAQETDAPWAVGRYGYMMDKYPYDKICIPLVSTRSAHGLSEVVSHEYAHVLVQSTTEGRSPKWLHEAIAMLAERSSDYRLRSAFAHGDAAWLWPHDLEITHSRNRQGEPDRERTWQAYQQSAWLGRYLVEQKGEAGIGDLLRGFANNSTWTELKMRVTGQTSADEALREVYGFGENELFERTLGWLRG